MFVLIVPIVELSELRGWGGRHSCRQCDTAELNPLAGVCYTRRARREQQQRQSPRDKQETGSNSGNSEFQLFIRQNQPFQFSLVMTEVFLLSGTGTLEADSRIPGVWDSLGAKIVHV